MQQVKWSNLIGQHGNTLGCYGIIYDMELHVTIG